VQSRVVKTPTTNVSVQTDAAANIQSNPKGQSVTDAATGFKDQGQFLAALRVSQNTNIPFDQLKAKMTGSSSVSLDAAIKQARQGCSQKR
jgi:hypothetical protein